jgi:hypothetical protein
MVPVYQIAGKRYAVFTQFCYFSGMFDFCDMVSMCDFCDISAEGILGLRSTCGGYRAQRPPIHPNKSETFH